jgi:hypothetical protein
MEWNHPRTKRISEQVSLCVRPADRSQFKIWDEQKTPQRSSAKYPVGTEDQDPYWL